ncbi:MAG: hypothetical protein HON53_09660 [Planctomycetaceae bacterium]|jgi:hypothetical protein|nr:hypothetical protein [Planctomycetaceae bacterium]MBT6157974.1 hypothetical protein [Planctomycetaceae bacterium]MBT6487389.1 hypothetical protein [Planctomycetaceae bacterium]MBT6496894.1 hypothetical protein [Planctomycetaceae bacterium]
MVDLREYTYGDWLRLCMRFVPALLVAQVIWSVILFFPFALVWFVLPL